MWQHPLCMALLDGFGLPVEEQLPLCREVGFDGFFVAWDRERFPRFASIARENSLFWQSVHAPFGDTAKLWKDSADIAEQAETALRELILCCEDCARHEVPIMVSHVYIGDFNTVGVPTGAGLDRFGRLFERASQLGVRVALENTEGEAYLDALLRHFHDHPAVGFCLDTGHEMCYNRSEDLLARYGDRLIATHINDNLGISRADGAIYYTDDLHLLPFDGICDWDAFGARLARVGYRGPLTFELNNGSKPGRHENDAYAALGVRGFFTAAYMRACRVAAKCPRV